MFEGGKRLCGPGLEVRIVAFRSVALEQIDGIFMGVLLIVLIGLVEVLAREVLRVLLWRTELPWPALVPSADRCGLAAGRRARLSGKRRG